MVNWQGERTFAVEKDVPVGEVDADGDVLAILLQAGQEFLADAQGRRPVRHSLLDPGQLQRKPAHSGPGRPASVGVLR